jgi:hypothetical protein
MFDDCDLGIRYVRQPSYDQSDPTRLGWNRVTHCREIGTPTNSMMADASIAPHMDRIVPEWQWDDVVIAAEAPQMKSGLSGPVLQSSEPWMDEASCQFITTWHGSGEKGSI